MKKRIKIVLLIVISFILTGCSVDYEMTIENKEINEVITISDNVTSTRNINDIKANFDIHYPIYIEDDIGLDDIKCDENCYEKELISSDTKGYIYKLSSKNNFKDFKNEAIYKLSSDIKGYNVENNTLVITLNNGIKYFDLYEDLEELNIKIKTTYEVLSTNADKKEDNTYIWNYTRSNNNGKNLFLSLNINKQETTEPNKDNNKENNKNLNSSTNKNSNSKNIIFVILLSILLYLIIIVFIAKRNRK